MQTTTPRDPTPTWAVITILSLAGMLAALQQTLVVPLIPELPSILGVSTDSASWMVTVTLLTGAVATPIVSKLADMFGKRRMIVITLAAMIVGSVLLAVGGTFATALVGRGLQGFAAALIPVGISIMRDELPPARVGLGVALMSATLGIGGALGLPLSGVLYSSLGWSSIFWVSAVVGILVTIGVLVLVDESTVQTPGRFDYRGAVLLSIALTGLLLAVSKGGTWGWTSREVLGLVALTVLVLLIWFPYELRVNDPMVDLRTSARRPVLLTNIASVLIAFGMFVNMLLTAQLLEMPESTGFGFGQSISEAGLAMVPAGLVMVLLSPFSGAMLGRLGGRNTLLIGGAVMSGAYVFRAFFSDSIPHVVVGSMLVGAGTAVAFAAMPTLIMASVPITETASANGLNSLMRAVGGATSSAVLAAILTSMTLDVGGTEMPSEAAFTSMYWLCAGAAFVACVVTVFIPDVRRAAAQARVGSPAVSDAGAGHETVVRGTVLPGGLAPARQMAIVTVTRTNGVPVDWARADHDGHYSVALPGPGRYLLVANARGWAPQAEVFEFTEAVALRDVTLREQLTLSGTVTERDAPVARALVTVNAGTGEFVIADHTDEHGRYRLPLPVPGPYIVTAMSPDSLRAKARKVVLSPQSIVVDIELPTVEHAAVLNA